MADSHAHRIVSWDAYHIERIFGAYLSDLGVLKNPLEVKNGATKLSEVPGHGVEFNHSVLKKCKLESGTVIERDPLVR